MCLINYIQLCLIRGGGGALGLPLPLNVTLINTLYTYGKPEILYMYVSILVNIRYKLMRIKVLCFLANKNPPV